MIVLTVSPSDEGQRFDKFLKRQLPAAQPSFLYKMLRKKNITLNRKKADGSEHIKSGDTAELFFSEETFRKFSTESSDESGKADDTGKVQSYLDACSFIEEKYPSLKIVYEDDDIMIVFKPAGLLSQKAEPQDRSLNEWFVGRLLKDGKTDGEKLSHFMPSVSNRLDRNTQGLVILSGTLQGSRAISQMLRERTLHKYYRMVVSGRIEKAGEVEAYLFKDEKTNTVRISEQGTYTKTILEPLRFSQKGSYTLVEAELVTGKTHQLRAHLSCLGHPIAGDPKYGDPAVNERLRKKGVRSQLLCCCRVEFPEEVPHLPSLSGRVVETGMPAVFNTVMQE